MDKSARNPWWQMWSGMRAYGVAITVIWAASAAMILTVLAIAIPHTWAHVGFSAAAVAEVGFSLLTLRFLNKASVRGRLDV